MGDPIVVNQSTSLVQVDTSELVFPNNAVVLLSSINAPGTIITIRDITGNASATSKIVVSTTQGLHYLDGPGCNTYSITQPYGFLTVTPRTSNIWAVINTFAFPDQAATPSVVGLYAQFGNFSNLYADAANINNLSVANSTFMNVAVTSSILARSVSTQNLAVTGTMSARQTSTLFGYFSSVNINNCNYPSTLLDVNGSMRASTIFLTNSAYIQGSLVYNSSEIRSTIRGLGTATYVSSPSLVSTVAGLGSASYLSSPSLFSTVAGLGTYGYVSSPSLYSTVIGLGSYGYISSPSLASTVQGLGSAGYVSSASYISTVQGLGTVGYVSSLDLFSTVEGLGSSQYVSSSQLMSTVEGLGTAGYVSSASLISTVQGLGSSQYVSSLDLFSTVQGLGSSQYVSSSQLMSTVQGLGSSQYVSSASLISTVRGLGSSQYVSSLDLFSTVQGLGTVGYVSSLSLASTVQGLGSSGYISSASFISSVQGLGTVGYVSSTHLVSTVQGLGSSGYLSTPYISVQAVSTISLVAYGTSTLLNSSNIYLGNNYSTNILRFCGTQSLNLTPTNIHERTVIGERFKNGPDTSELILFKSNNPGGFPGPDSVRVLSAGGFQVDIAQSGVTWPINGNPPSTIIQAMIINASGQMGINCNSPSYTLDVAGSINAASITINGSLLVTTSNIISSTQGLGSSQYVSSSQLMSTVQGLGTAGYVSSYGAALASTVQGLGSSQYVSSSQLISTVQGLGSSQYVSSSQLMSTVQGLGTAGYVSSYGAALASTVQGLGTSQYVSSSQLISTVQGLGTAGYVSSYGTSLASTVQGLGTSQYVSSSQLISTVQGLGTTSYISSSQLMSTVQGLGTAGYVSSYGTSLASTVQGLGTSSYISSPSLISTVQGLGTTSYISSPSLISTVQGLGTASYISSPALISTVQGLGSSGYLSTPDIIVNSIQTSSLTVYGPSTFILASNMFIGNSVSTNTLRFIGTAGDGIDSEKYTNTVIAERIQKDPEASELLLFKGNDASGFYGSDRVRVLASGGFRVDIASNNGNWPIGGQPPSTLIQALTINNDGRVGISTETPNYTLDVNGTINALSNIYVNGSQVVTFTSGNPSNIILNSNLLVGNNPSTNALRFSGTWNDGSNQYSHTVIGERIYAIGELSELLIFKGDNSGSPDGPDRIRMLSAGGFKVDITSNYATWPIGSQPPETIIEALTISTNGSLYASCNIFVNGAPVLTSGGGSGGSILLTCNVGINCNTPAYTLDVGGEIHSLCNISSERSISAGGNVYATSNIYMNGSLAISNVAGGGIVLACNVGINCNVPAYTLDVGGQIHTPSNILACNIGISCNSPAYTLDVNGQGKFTGTVGIGTAPTIYSLTVGGSINIMPNGGSIYINEGYGIYDNLNVFRLQCHTDHYTYYNATEHHFRASNGSTPYANINSVGIYSFGDVTAASDARMKENIVTIDLPLEKIMHMRGVYFDKISDKTRHIGVIAQEIEKVLPEVVSTDNTPEKMKGVAYGNITGILIEGMKAQQSTIESMQAQIDELKGQ